MAGRPPKSTKELKEQGTYRKDRHAARLQHPILDTIPAPPAYFTEKQAERWKMVCGMLIRDGQLSDTYIPALENYCNAWKRWSEAAAEVDSRGLTFETDTGQIRANPAINIEREMLSLMMNILDKFGYTPRAAMSIKVSGKEKEDNDPLSFLTEN